MPIAFRFYQKLLISKTTWLVLNALLQNGIASKRSTPRMLRDLPATRNANTLPSARLNLRVNRFRKDRPTLRPRASD
jgi:hypothetical protein